MARQSKVHPNLPVQGKGGGQCRASQGQGIVPRRNQKPEPGDGVEGLRVPNERTALIPAIGVRGRLQSLWQGWLESGRVKALAGKADGTHGTHVKEERTGSLKLSPGILARCGKPHPAAHHTK